MAINSVSFVSPKAEPQSQEKPKKTPMEQILEGLQIANGVLGIGKNVQDIRESSRNIEIKDKQIADLDRQVSRDTADELRKAEMHSALVSETQARTAKANAAQQTPLQRASDPIAERRMKLAEEQFAYLKKRNASTDAERKAAAAVKQTPPAGQAPAIKLNAEERKRLDSASMGLSAVRDMGEALAAGTNTFSIVGDNDFTAARTRFEEAIGRMQSGGAINNDEAARFRSMAPTFKDSGEMQGKKMDELYREMALRVKSLGADPDEVLASRESVAVPTFGNNRPRDGQAVAAPAGKPKKVIQGGHTYILNEKTGEYE